MVPRGYLLWYPVGITVKIFLKKIIATIFTPGKALGQGQGGIPKITSPRAFGPWGRIILGMPLARGLYPPFMAHAGRMGKARG